MKTAIPQTAPLTAAASSHMSGRDWAMLLALAAIWGEHDLPHFDPAVQEAAIRSRHPQLEFRVVDGAGHWAMYERPEGFNAALLELLAMDEWG